ncbi:isopentenyl-diphosphate delta-isomerase [Sphingobacteriaceae bacterium]|nr:isopentenyl-diphosphate delta-isomerase [Sphingobacteriaceae bacterium]
MTEEVILVNEQDQELGTMEKMEAHVKGLLHRAFSVFIFNSKKELLIQQRALSKYHSPALWTNTCCSHPRPGEKTHDAALRRMREEMGMETTLEHMSSFIYKTTFENGLTEFEYDHIYTGKSNEDPIINPKEVNAYKWMSLDDIKSDLKTHPEIYTYWFKLAIEKLF